MDTGQDKPETVVSGANEHWKSRLPDMVGDLLSDALDVDATDIHVDPVGLDAYRVCFRVDGVIHQHKSMSEDDGRQLLNQIKVAAQFTPDRTFSALESRIALGSGGEQREVRVTILPTVRHEVAHLRLLSPPEEVLDPTELGLSEEQLESIRETLRHPEGLILVSGATGVGKTMTLYSLASFLELESMIAVSVEDPVEFNLRYIRQIQADPDHGLSMPEALKTVLRMDPDIILVGEIRDVKSAVTAVRAGAAGRFVLATLHATDVPLAIEACHYFSVPRHLLSSAIRLVISQALVRRVCDSCAGRRELNENEARMFVDEGLDVPDHVPVARGCEACHDFGYHGRTGVFQVVPIDHDLAASVSNPREAGAFRKTLAERKIASLRKHALSKVAAGVTTIEEVLDLHFPGTSDDEWSGS